MSMDNRLSKIWKWLPAFRAIAETEHLPTAAERMQLTPAALSRQLKKLEEQLGEEVFHRKGRSLALNSTGERLLDATRIAVRTVDRSLEDIDENPFRRELTISSIGVMTKHFVLPALLDLKEEHQGFTPDLKSVGTSSAHEQLLAGELDVAFYYESLTTPELDMKVIGESTASVYCGRQHPLFGEDNVGLQQIQTHAFSVPQTGEHGDVVDRWPSEVEREIGFRITKLESNLEVGLSGEFLVVLPDVTAVPYLKEGRLCRLKTGIIPPTNLYVAYLPGQADNPVVSSVVEAVEDRIRAFEVRKSTVFDST